MRRAAAAPFSTGAEHELLATTDMKPVVAHAGVHAGRFQHDSEGRRSAELEVGRLHHHGLGLIWPLSGEGTSYPRHIFTDGSSSALVISTLMAPMWFRNAVSRSDPCERPGRSSLAHWQGLR